MPAQAVLRWHIQLGHIVFPKSTTPSRIKENFQLFDFELDSGDMDKITGLDKDEDGRIGPHPDRSQPGPDRRGLLLRSPGRDPPGCPHPPSTKNPR
jgi:2,5-diketo-D-gluconate reductase A